MTAFRFVCVVWGRDYTDSYLRASLPSQLFPGNLPSVTAADQCIYRIYTTARDSDYIRQTAAYRHLRELMPVEIVEIGGLWRVGKYRVVTACHRHFIESTVSERCVHVYLYPDVVWADDSFAQMAEIARTRTRVLLVEGPRLTKETFLPDALTEFGHEGHLTTPMSGRQLIGLALKHLHPETQAMCWDSAHRANFPAFLFWRVGTSGLLMRQFCANPLMVKPDRRPALPSSTSALDGDYISNLGVGPDEIYTVTDSDDICMVDFTSVATRPNAIRSGPQTPLQVATWAKWNATPQQHTFVRHKIRLHADELSPAWMEVERRSDVIVDEIGALIETDLPRPVAPSRTRFLSPRFVAEQLREKGLAVCTEVPQRLLRSAGRAIAGDQISMSIRHG